MTTADLQTTIQHYLAEALENIGRLWEEAPTQQIDTVAKLLKFVSTLADPKNAARLDILAKLVVETADNGQKKDVLAALLATSSDSTEFQFVQYVLGDGTTVPSWEQVAGKLVMLAVADGMSVASAAPPVRPTPVPPSPVAPPPRSANPATTFLANRRPAPVPATAAPAKVSPPPPPPATRPAVATPASVPAPTSTRPVRRIGDATSDM